MPSVPRTVRPDFGDVFGAYLRQFKPVATVGQGERTSFQGARAAQYLHAPGRAKAIKNVLAAMKSGKLTPELLAYQYLQTLVRMSGPKPPG